MWSRGRARVALRACREMAGLECRGAGSVVWLARGPAARLVSWRSWRRPPPNFVGAPLQRCRWLLRRFVALGDGELLGLHGGVSRLRRRASRFALAAGWRGWSVVVLGALCGLRGAPLLGSLAGGLGEDLPPTCTITTTKSDRANRVDENKRLGHAVGRGPQLPAPRGPSWDLLPGGVDRDVRPVASCASAPKPRAPVQGRQVSRSGRALREERCNWSLTSFGSASTGPPRRTRYACSVPTGSVLKQTSVKHDGAALRALCDEPREARRWRQLPSLGRH